MIQHSKYLLTFLLITLVSTISTTRSSANDTLRIVDQYGQLHVEGTRIVNEHDDTVALRGMSLFWSQWIGKYYNYDCIEWLRDDWKCMVVRAAMAVDAGGYLTNPEVEKAKVIEVIDACIDLGIYVIVDWHSHNAHNQTSDAVEFFSEIATLYGDQPNLIYEIYNEPLQISWSGLIKPYADTVIAAIRAIDPDNIILVGTPTWSQDVDIASEDPIDDDNVAYSLHFYAGTHTGWLRSKASYAMTRGLALWVNEFGTCSSSGDGPIAYSEMELWFDYMDDRMLSWCNWSIADKEETSAALIPGASDTGGWSPSELSESGALIRSRLIAWAEQGYKPLPVGIQESGKIKNLNVEIVPNPVCKNAIVNIDLPYPQEITINLYNLSGEKIKTYQYQAGYAGEHSVCLDVSGLPSGEYICNVVAPEWHYSSRIGVQSP